MQTINKNITIILITGLLGILGALLNSISDAIMLGNSISSKEFLDLGTRSMIELSQWRITVGSILGLFVMPLQIIGLYPIYYALKPAGKWWSWTIVILFSHAIIMGTVFHGSYTFIGTGLKTYELSRLSETGALLNMINTFDFYWKVFLGIMLVEIFIGSVCFIVAILLRKTIYPKWMYYFNPVFIALVLAGILILVPSPVGGFIFPTYLNLIVIVFYTISLIVIYKSLMSIEYNRTTNFLNPLKNTVLSLSNNEI